MAVRALLLMAVRALSLSVLYYSWLSVLYHGCPCFIRALYLSIMCQFRIEPSELYEQIDSEVLLSSANRIDIKNINCGVYGLFFTLDGLTSPSEPGNEKKKNEQDASKYVPETQCVEV